MISQTFSKSIKNVNFIVDVQILHLPKNFFPCRFVSHNYLLDHHARENAHVRAAVKSIHVAAMPRQRISKVLYFVGALETGAKKAGIRGNETGESAKDYRINQGWRSFKSLQTRNADPRNVKFSFFIQPIMISALEIFKG